MSVKMRQEVERKIAEAFVKSALVAGYRISVDNGEDVTNPLRSARTILSHMFLTDQDRLYVYKKGSHSVVRMVGFSLSTVTMVGT